LKKDKSMLEQAEDFKTPGCKLEPGVVVPVIDRNRCEGAGDCVAVCPVSVFSLIVLPQEERGSLSLKGKIKGVVHGWRQADTPNAIACEACGLCVQACPEKAIRLKRSVATARQVGAVS
jgi:4Fe-4S ferredoxin